MQQLSKPIKLFVATKCVLLNNGRMLLLREADTYAEGTNIGKYDIPGGRLQPGESAKDALEREIMEETGQVIRYEDARPFYVRDWRVSREKEEWQIVAIFFAAITNSNAVKLSIDHDKYDWFTLQEAIKLPSMNGDYSQMYKQLQFLCSDLIDKSIRAMA